MIGKLHIYVVICMLFVSHARLSSLSKGRVNFTDH